MPIKILPFVVLALGASLAVSSAAYARIAPSAVQVSEATIDRIASSGRTQTDIVQIPALIAQFPDADEEAQFSILAILHYTALNRETEPALPSASWETIKEFCFDLLSQPTAPALQMAVRSVLYAGDDLGVIDRAVTMLEHESADVRYNGISLLVGHVALLDHLDRDILADTLAKAVADPDPRVSNSASALEAHLR